jgi:hypothetical protein
VRRWLAIIGAFTVAAAIVVALAWPGHQSYRRRYERIPKGADKKL